MSAGLRDHRPTPETERPVSVRESLVDNPRVELPAARETRVLLPGTEEHGAPGSDTPTALDPDLPP